VDPPDISNHALQTEMILHMELDKSTKRIAKKAKKGFQGYPVITIAYYGPNDKRATNGLEYSRVWAK